MKKYTFWYSETDTYRGHFEAESLEQAQAMLDNVFDGEGMLSDLPSFEAVGKNYEAEYSPESLVEWS